MPETWMLLNVSERTFVAEEYIHLVGDKYRSYIHCIMMREREYGIRNTEILFNKAIAPFEGV